jgi:hypothetical protein
MTKEERMRIKSEIKKLIAEVKDNPEHAKLKDRIEELKRKVAQV